MTRGGSSSVLGVVAAALVAVAAGVLLELDSAAASHPLAVMLPVGAGLGLAALTAGRRRPSPTDRVPELSRIEGRVGAKPSGRLPLRLDVRTVSLAKDGAAASDDAWAADPASGRAAVADGASSTFGSGAWADILARRFVAIPPDPAPDRWSDWVAAAAEHWAEATAGADDTWLTEEARRRGSFATLLGIQVDPLPNGAASGAIAHWRVTAVGDSCVAWLRRSASAWRLIDSFPLDHPEAFGTNPQLVGTVGRGMSGAPVVRQAEGAAIAGDALVLLSDAVAQWSLLQDRTGAPVWHLLVECGKGLREAVSAAQENESMVRDDVTVVAITIEA